MNQVPEWTKKLFLIKSDHLFKQRSHSVLVGINKINMKYLKDMNLNDLASTFPSVICNNSGNYSINHNFSRKSYNNYSQSSNNNQNVAMHRLFKLVKLAFTKMEEEKIKLKNVENISIEWKELARRLEYVFFLISTIAIVITPTILFGKFFMRDVITLSHINTPCGCEHSFVRNI